MSYRCTYALRIGTIQEQPFKTLFRACGPFPVVLRLNDMADTAFSPQKRDDPFGNLEEFKYDAENSPSKIDDVATQEYPDSLQQVPEDILWFSR
jgi:hypothetical protein